MATKVRIANKLVGEGEPCFIIAEAGSNHNGNLEQAKHLIDIAAFAQADAVKFQLFRAEKLYPKHAGTIDAERVGNNIYEALAKLEMPIAWISELAAYCESKDIIFLSSVFDESSADALAPYVPAFKIASYEITHIPLIQHTASKGKPVILSTGGAQMAEIAEAVSTVRRAGIQDLVLLHCTAEYPAPLNSLNLRALIDLRETFQVPCGLSDHSRDPVLAPVAAVALGASVIEKHFTLSNQLPGPDHEFALEPSELFHMISAIRQTEEALGTGIKSRHPVEGKRTAFGRRCLFATENIRIGEFFTGANVSVLRRGELKGGLHPRYYALILGTRAQRSILAGTAITSEDVDVHLEIEEEVE